MPNDTYIKADYIEHLNLLKPNGFTLNNDEIFEKTINNGKIFLYLGADEHFPHGVGFRQVMVNISYTNVENLFNQACNATTNTSYKAKNDRSTFGLGFGRSVIGEEGFDILYDNEVVDDHSFQIVRPLLEQMINAALAWVNQNDTLQKAYDNAELLPTNRDRSKIYSHPFPAKYMIVKKLMNASDYSTYSADAVNYYINKPNSNEGVFYQALKTILDAL